MQAWGARKRLGPAAGREWRGPLLPSAHAAPWPVRASPWRSRDMRSPPTQYSRISHRWLLVSYLRWGGGAEMSWSGGGHEWRAGRSPRGCLVHRPPPQLLPPPRLPRCCCMSSPGVELEDVLVVQGVHGAHLQGSDAGTIGVATDGGGRCSQATRSSCARACPSWRLPRYTRGSCWHATAHPPLPACWLAAGDVACAVRANAAPLAGRALFGSCPRS